MPFAIRHVRINKQGYDRSGQYWGIGKPLYEWEYTGDNEEIRPTCGHIRAHDRQDAKVQIRTYFKSYFTDHLVIHCPDLMKK